MGKMSPWTTLKLGRPGLTQGACKSSTKLTIRPFLASHQSVCLLWCIVRQCIGLAPKVCMSHTSPWRHGAFGFLAVMDYWRDGFNMSLWITGPELRVGLGPAGQRKRPCTEWEGQGLAWLQITLMCGMSVWEGTYSSSQAASFLFYTSLHNELKYCIWVVDALQVSGWISVHLSRFSDILLTYSEMSIVWNRSWNGIHLHTFAWICLCVRVWPFSMNEIEFFLRPQSQVSGLRCQQLTAIIYCSHISKKLEITTMNDSQMNHWRLGRKRWAYLRAKQYGS